MPLLYHNSWESLKRFKLALICCILLYLNFTLHNIYGEKITKLLPFSSPILSIYTLLTYSALCLITIQLCKETKSGLRIAYAQWILGLIGLIYTLRYPFDFYTTLPIIYSGFFSAYIWPFYDYDESYISHFISHMLFFSILASAGAVLFASISTGISVILNSLFNIQTPSAMDHILHFTAQIVFPAFYAISIPKGSALELSRLQSLLEVILVTATVIVGGLIGVYIIKHMVQLHAIPSLPILAPTFCLGCLTAYTLGYTRFQHTPFVKNFVIVVFFLSLLTMVHDITSQLNHSNMTEKVYYLIYVTSFFTIGLAALLLRKNSIQVILTTLTIFTFLISSEPFKPSSMVKKVNAFYTTHQKAQKG